MTDLAALRARIQARLDLAEAAFEPWLSAGKWAEALAGDWSVAPRDIADGALIADRDPAAVAAECRADLVLLSKVEAFAPLMPPGGLGWSSDITRNLAARYPEPTP